MSEREPSGSMLALLRDVEAGHVIHRWPMTSQQSYARNERTGRKVTHAMRALRAGRLVVATRPNGITSTYRLTDAGRAVLDAHGGDR